MVERRSEAAGRGLEESWTSDGRAHHSDEKNLQSSVYRQGIVVLASLSCRSSKFAMRNEAEAARIIT
jgi:hypothetical protein